MAFNLFGDLAADLAQADRDPAFLNSLRAFDVMFVLDLADGTQGVVGVDTKYHERTKPETPKATNLRRYLEVAERAAVFEPRAIDMVKGRSDLAVMWLEHLLLLSMLQHSSGRWSWGRYVVVHPAGNADFADACTRYTDLLREPATFSSLTLERLLDGDLLPTQANAAVRDRYVPA
jgi:hypothetical protein